MRSFYLELEHVLACSSRGLALLSMCPTTGAMHIESIALIVDDYDRAIAFYVGVLGFELVEDSPATTTDGRPKRWVVVCPRGARTGFVLAKADGEEQSAAIGRQFAGRVGVFLRVDQFDELHQRLLEHGVEFVRDPKSEPYGEVAVFLDPFGNRWDLLGPPNAAPDRGVR